VGGESAAAGRRRVARGAPSATRAVPLAGAGSSSGASTGASDGWRSASPDASSDSWFVLDAADGGDAVWVIPPVAGTCGGGGGGGDGGGRGAASVSSDGDGGDGDPPALFTSDPALFRLILHTVAAVTAPPAPPSARIAAVGAALRLAHGSTA